MSIGYREGTNIDPEKLDRLWEAIGWKKRGSEKWEEVLSKSYFVYTAWDSDRLVGMGRLAEDGAFCGFYDIAVYPDYQRMGIGTKIMKRLIDKAKRGNYAGIHLFPDEENNPGVAEFYRKLGFKERKAMKLSDYMNPE